MTTDLDPWDDALLAALGGDERLSSPSELAAEAGVSEALLESLVRVGLVVPRPSAEGPRFRPDSAQAIRAGMDLVDAGLPLAELLDLARRMNEALASLAEESVDVFVRFIRDAVAAGAETDEAAADRLVAAFTVMLPAAERLLAGHFRALVLAAGRRRLEAR